MATPYRLSDAELQQSMSRLGMATQGGFSPQPQRKKRNFWLDQLSTAGSIAGGIGGSFIAPVAGTAGGAALGGALGETIENLIDPEGGNWGNVGKEALVSGVMGGGPLKLLKGGAAGARALATGADDVAKVASQAAMTPLRQSIGKGVTGAADNLAVKSFRLTPTQLANFKGKFGKDAGEVIRKYGFTSADDIATKGTELLQGQFDTLVTGIPGVTKDALKKSFDSRITKLIKAGPTDKKLMGQQLKKEADSILKGYGDVVDAKSLNTLRREFDSLVNYTAKAADPNKYGVNKRMADALRETLQKADPTGNLKTVGKELQSLRQLSDIAAKQGQLGRGSLPFGLTDMLGAGVGAGSFGGPAGALGGFAATQAVNSNTGRKLAMKGAERLGGKLATAQGGQSAFGITGRLGATGLMKTNREQPQGLEGALMGDQSFENNATSMMNPTSANAPMNANNMGSSYNTSDPLSNAMGVEQSPYGRQNLMADIQRDPQNADKYIEYYQMMDEIFGAQADPMGDMSQSSRNAMASSDNAINTVDQLEEMFNAAGGGGGRVGGAIKNLTGRAGFNEEAKIYNDLANASVTQIAKALAGSGAGTVSDMDAKVIMDALARFNDNPNEARAKFAALRQRLENARNNTMLYAGSGQEDPLMGAMAY
jgi:hypothetical protein